jgi:hypothetical protein
LRASWMHSMLRKATSLDIEGEWQSLLMAITLQQRIRTDISQRRARPSGSSEKE